MHWSIEARGYHKVNPHYLMCHNENVTPNTPYQQNHNTFIMVLAMFGPAVKQCVSQPYTQSSTVYDTLSLLATLVVRASGYLYRVFWDALDALGYSYTPSCEP